MKRRLLYIPVIIALLTGCDNETTLVDGQEKEPLIANIMVALGGEAAPGTRAPANDDPYQDNLSPEVNITHGMQIYQKISGAISKHSLNPNIGTGSPYSKTIKVSGDASDLYMEFNSDGAPHPNGSGTLSSLVNTRQGGGNSAVVRVDNWPGGANITGDATGGNGSTQTPYILPITISPEMARFEIKNTVANSSAGGNYLSVTDANIKPRLTEVKFMAIYFNNIKEDRTSTALRRVADSPSGNWNANYSAGGFWSNMYHGYGSTGTESLTFGTSSSGTSILWGSDIHKIIESGKALGFNIFPQALTSSPTTDKAIAKAGHPHLIVKLNGKIRIGGTDAAPVYSDMAQDYYVNIVAFRDKATNNYKSIGRGNIYEINIAEFLRVIFHPDTPLTDIPDPDGKTVTVNVTVSPWDNATITDPPIEPI